MRDFSKADNHPYLSIAIVGIIVTLPLLLVGLPYHSDDGVSHFLYQTNFSAQLWQGEIYPRWLTFINGGFGGPTFFYYPPLPYYITTVFSILPTNSWHHLGLSASFGLILSGITAFIWLREIADKRPALIAALLYMLAPYHLNYDIYARAAFAESFTFVWMPLVLFFANRLIRNDRYAFVGLALSFAALCSTHLLTTLMFGAVPLFYILLRSPRTEKLKKTLSGIAAMTLGAGTAAVFILPAISYMDWVFLSEARDGHFDFAHWLMPPTLFINGSLKYFWMSFTVFAAGLFCFLSTWKEIRSDQKPETHIWLIVMCGTLLMMTYLSYPIWLIVTPLQMVQFPWRFNTVLCVSALPMIAIGVQNMRRPFSRLQKFTIGLIAFLTFVSTFDLGAKYLQKFINPPDVSRNLRRHQQYAERQDTHPQWPRSVTYGLTPETQKGTLPHLEAARSKLPVFRENEVSAFATKGTVAIERADSRSIFLDVRSEVETTVTVTQFSFPGWVARFRESSESIPISVTSDLGLISFDLPQGEHHIALTLDELPAERAGKWISLASLLLLGLIAMMGIKSDRGRNAELD